MTSPIKKLRTQAGISAIELANKIGTSKQALYNWETGETTPTSENLLKLASFFGVDPNQLLSNDENGKDLSSKEQLLINQFRSLPENKRSVVIALMMVLAKD